MSADPEKILKERKKEEKRRDKQRAKLEKKFQSGKIDGVTYRRELNRLGFFTHKDILEDFRREIQEEIEYLENLDLTEGAAGNVPPPPGMGEDRYTDDYTERPSGDAADAGARVKSPAASDLDFKAPGTYHEGEEPEYEELSEEDADWEFDDDLDWGDEPEAKPAAEPVAEPEAVTQVEPVHDDHTHDIPEVKIDERDGVIAYEDIKHVDYEDARVMDSYEEASVVGASKKKLKRSKRGGEVDRRRDRSLEDEEEEELSEAEKLMQELEKEPEEMLDLDEVFIPDVESTLKSKGLVKAVSKLAPSIMWEADSDDRLWLEKRIVEEALELGKRHRAWRRRRRERGEVERWEVYKLVKKPLKDQNGKPIAGKKRQVWKVRLCEKEESEDVKDDRSKKDKKVKKDKVKIEWE